MSTNEAGRTMLEMLGVLAIMGIIIYGAINGINSGMTSYKVNQVYSDVSTAIKEIQDIYLFLGNNYTSIDSCILIKNNIYDGEIEQEGPPCKANIPHPFGGQITIDGNSTIFTITYNNIHETEDNPIKSRICDLDWDQVSVCCKKDSNNLKFSPKTTEKCN